MTVDRTEQLIREAFAEEADRAPDAREVMAELHRRRGRPARRYGLIVAAAVAVVAAAVATFVMPEVFKRSSPPAAEGREQAVVTPRAVLVVGVDTLGLTDTVVLTRVNPDGSVDLISLPRDTWAQQSGGGMSKLNQVYAKAGIDTLLATVGDLTGVTPDHYAIVDMTAVGELATAVGGVPVCLRAATSDPMTDADFAAGPQTVAGPAALAFVRQRHGLPSGDLDRIVRQQVFLRGLASTVRGADLSAVLAAVQGKVETDEKLDLLGFAEDLSRATALHVGTIPTVDLAYAPPEGGSVIKVDPVRVRQFVDELQGTPPESGDVPCVN